MNEVIKNMKERRSIRAYKNDQITDAQLDAILEAGTYAASGMGSQSTVIVPVQDPEIIAVMSGLNAKVMGMDIDPFYGAPTVVVVFADAAETATPVEDGSLVIGNMMLAAFSEGVDSCWVHRAKEVFETEEGKALKAKWGIGDSFVGIGNCILGYREGDLPPAPERKAGRIVRI
ncbi:MAG: nitroreductase family protein [Firmicutes bacterium]|nr:nitroreductase family protein [Bacillota bacterium]